jgi:ceramide glucosyltransferase
MQTGLEVLAGAFSLLALAGAGYFAMCIWAGSRFVAEQREGPAFTPPVSILKSLKGVDPHMRAAFRSHCLLDYPEYEVLFGVNDLSDPAAALVKEVKREFPDARLRVIHCPKTLGANGKISTLTQLLPCAKYEHVLINDSDILVEPDFLRRVMRYFANAKVGVVTTLYRALTGRSLWSKLEALGVNTDFMGGVMVAREIEGGVRFALGATMATTKSVLAKIGGLESLVDVLGDDYELGARAAAAGYQVELADPVVETAIADYRWIDFWHHQLRWARTNKGLRPGGYFGLVVTFALPWAMLAVLAAPGAWWTWAVLTLVILVRAAAASLIGLKILRDSEVGRDFWLIPVRDCTALAVWIASYLGDTVVWRGQRFRLRNGHLIRSEGSRG